MSAKKRGNPSNEVPWYEGAAYQVSKDAAKAALSTFEATGTIYDTMLKQEQAALTAADRDRIEIYKSVTKAASDVGYTQRESEWIASTYVADEADKARIALELAQRLPAVPIDQILYQWQKAVEEEEKGLLDWILDKLGGLLAGFPSPGEMFGTIIAYAITGLSKWIWDELAEALKPPEVPEVAPPAVGGE